MPFMTHPIHGATNVGSGEVEAHEVNGWKISTHEEWLAPKLKGVTDAVALVQSAANDLAGPQRKKIGRPSKAK